MCKCFTLDSQHVLNLYISYISKLFIGHEMVQITKNKSHELNLTGRKVNLIRDDLSKSLS